MHIDSSVTEQDWDSGNVALWSCSSHAVFEHCGLSPALKIYHCVQSLGFEMWVLLSSLITVFAWCLVSLFYTGLCLLSLTYRWNISVLFYICYKIKKRNTTTNHSNCCFPFFFASLLFCGSQEVPWVRYLLLSWGWQGAWHWCEYIDFSDPALHRFILLHPWEWITNRINGFFTTDNWVQVSFHSCEVNVYGLKNLFLVGAVILSVWPRTISSECDNPEAFTQPWISILFALLYVGCIWH